jgi:hypothetical protein
MALAYKRIRGQSNQRTVFLKRAASIIMTGMNKRLAVLAVVGGVVLVIGVIALVTSATKKDTCEAFILNIEKGDHAGTYAKFTDDTKKLISAKDWEAQVGMLKGAYYNQKPKLFGDPVVQNDTTTQKPVSTQYIYGIQYGENKYRATCTTPATEPDKVQSFSSKAGF